MLDFYTTFYLKKIIDTEKNRNKNFEKNFFFNF